MEKINIVYWSQTGNTESMAKAIGEGVLEAGKEGAVITVDKIDMGELEKATVFALGCPSMGAENLEEDEMEPFVEKVEAFAKGKNIVLFGSYGWGDGEWMRDWAERMTQAGAHVLNGEGLICQEMPDTDGLEECRELGKMMAKL